MFLMKLCAPYISLIKLLLITDAQDDPRTTGTPHNCEPMFGAGPGHPGRRGVRIAGIW